jgi:hypothetical protein
MKELKQSTINRYSVYQLAKHADRFQDHHGINMYRFDFTYGKVYELAECSFLFFATLHPYNRPMLLDALNKIYEAAK